MLPLTILISVFAVAAFVWAARAGQLDDLTTPPLRMLADESPPEPPPRQPASPPDL
ncbi:MAG TPA: cbb3-type cytochrome oxidase assembly protein CcoS [Polyangiaceae bacterium]|nr:cbb3-type cytochrome oxidase assembly protein CcoS [Polyangiaceae bacterium]